MPKITPEMFIIDRIKLKLVKKSGWRFDKMRVIKSLQKAESKECKKPSREYDKAKQILSKYDKSMSFIIDNMEAINYYWQIKEFITKNHIPPNIFEGAMLASMFDVKTENDEPVYDVGTEMYDILVDNGCPLAITHFENMGYLPFIQKITSNDPVTVIKFADNTESKVKCRENANFDVYTGILAAIVKKAVGNKHYKHIIKLIEQELEKSDNIMKQDN